jgi:hypothetical protein
MKRSLLLAALVASSALAPVGAFAMDSMSSGMKAMPATMWVCRAPNTGETATAKTTDGKELVCKTVDTHKVMAGPDMSSAKTMKDVNDRWKDYLTQQFAN